jgi:hypothetical protein
MTEVGGAARDARLSLRGERRESPQSRAATADEVPLP